MREFFHGWRRKAGVAVLVMAIMTFVVSRRSHDRWDRLFIRAGMTMHILTSSDGSLSWYSREVRDLEVYSSDLVPEWKSFDAVTARTFSMNYPPETWAVPHWSLVLPLTLLSCLILWKPRKRTEPEHA